MSHLMTENKAKSVLYLVKDRHGRCWKQPIRTAWITGNYRAEGLDDWSSELQQIRNKFGPTWLHNLRLED